MKSRWSKLFWGALAVVAGFYLIRHLFAVILVEAPRADLDIVLIAAKRFMAGESIYRIDDQWEHTKPPLLMALAYPMAMVPHFWIRLFWDLAIFVMPPLVFWIGRDLFPERFRDRWTWRALVLTWAVMYPLWYREAELGQYNLFVFFLMLLAAVWLRSGSVTLHFFAGMFAVFSVIVKPSQLYLLPWVLVAFHDLPDARKRIFRASGGALILVLGLAAVYASIRTPQGLLSDHREYFEFLKLSSAKHLMRKDNFGLPTLLSRLGLHDFVASGAFMPVTLVMTAISTWALRSKDELALHAATLLMLAFSPMCWKANFGVLLLVTFGLARQVERRPSDGRAWVGLVAMLIVSRASEYWFGVELLQWFGTVAAPLWLMAAALGCLALIRQEVRE